MYAYGSGDIVLRKETPEHFVQEMVDVFENVEEVRQGENICYDVFTDEKYRYWVFQDVFIPLNKYTVEGEVHWNGDDGTHWRYRFDKESGNWVEEVAHVVFAAEDLDDRMLKAAAELYARRCTEMEGRE